MRERILAVIAAVLLLAPPAAVAAGDDDTYDKETVLGEAVSFFGEGAEGIAEVIEKAFRDQGRPNGYIKGEEAGGAIGIGIRYGSGTLSLKAGTARKVHWQGPSIGFDLGASAAKVFVLIYNLKKVETLFQRFPSIEGSLYIVAGAGINYMRSDDVTLAPIRLGVGWRAGASVGYMHFTRKKSWNPL